MRTDPSIVPGSPEDFYIVINRYGRHGVAFAETELCRADLETTIGDLMAGQHSDPLGVIMFNPETNRSEDVSQPSHRKSCAASGLKGATCRSNWKTSLIAMSARIAS